MSKTNSKADQLVKMTLILPTVTYKSIHKICERLQCQPGEYISALVIWDTQRTPQDILAINCGLIVDNLKKQLVIDVKPMSTWNKSRCHDKTKITVTVAPEICALIHKVCRVFRCKPGRYLDNLVMFDECWLQENFVSLSLLMEGVFTYFEGEIQAAERKNPTVY